MAGLRSKLFKGDPALEACLVSDAAHITQGAVGDHVGKIQKALFTLDGLSIDDGELSAQRYGASTAAAVLSFKTDRGIINRSYQTQPDNIVGKMTIAALDDELFGLPPTMSSLAERDKTVSLSWAQATIVQLIALQALLRRGPNAPIPLAVRPIFRALETHYHISTVAIPRIDFIDTVLGLYRKAVGLLNNSSAFFVDDTSSDEAKKGTPAHVPFGSGKVNFTPAFQQRKPSGLGFGPLCRAAMVLHEPFHVVDHPDASFAQNHIGENDPRYGSQPAANQLHNAHSYAAFAQQIFFGADTRFGAGKPAL